ncbi:MAG: c-type cytochrome [Ilyomonas sp.]
MKKYFVTAALMVLVAACGNNNTETTKEKTEDAKEAASGDVTANPDYEKGLALVSSSDCFTCHKVTEKLVGPAYQEVADKYAGSDTAVTYLAHKIIHGGSGVWGNVAMTPHPQLSLDSAEAMVKYILLLKNQ